MKATADTRVSIETCHNDVVAQIADFRDLEGIIGRSGTAIMQISEDDRGQIETDFATGLTSVCDASGGKIYKGLAWEVVQMCQIHEDSSC